MSSVMELLPPILQQHLHFSLQRAEWGSKDFAQEEELTLQENAGHNHQHWTPCDYFKQYTDDQVFKTCRRTQTSGKCSSL